MCGKYLMVYTPLEISLGSPPHVREVLRKLFNDIANSRITPACAGSTR